MKSNFSKTSGHIAAILTAFLLWPAPAAMAQSDTRVSDLIVTNAWMRFAPPMVKTHAGYFTLRNEGKTKRILIGAASPTYGMVGLHISKVENNVATMQKLEQVAIAPGKMIMFKTGGMHLMYMGAKAKQKLGAMVPTILMFQNGEKIMVHVVIKRKPGMLKMDHHKHKMN